MNNIQKRRIYYLIAVSISILLGVGLILFALKQNINVFVTPSELTKRAIGSHFRLGGVVKVNSVRRNDANLEVNFIITDTKKDILVSYQGILPDLFREGKGVIAEGVLSSEGVFIAQIVLAKHDENYMPQKVYQAMREKV